MKTVLTAYGAALGTIVVLDAIWLGVVARGFYAAQLGPLLLSRPNFAVAAVFYLIHAGALTLLATSPALSSGAWTTALLNGAVLGLCAYAAYDLTNLATLKGWSVPLTLVDIAWGTAVTAAAAVVGFFAARAVAAS